MSSVVRIREFEGLRGWMAYWVVLGHVSNSIALGMPEPLPKDLSGHSAVSVFIALSGFVITLLLLERREPYPVFLVRRALRLFPVYFLCLMASVALLGVTRMAFEQAPATAATAGRLRLLDLGQGALAEHVLAHLTMLHGLAGRFLPGASYTLLGQAWSVSVEWQFYLLAPLMVRAVFDGDAWAAVGLCGLCGLLFVWAGASAGGTVLTHVGLFALGIHSCHLWRRLRTGQLSWTMPQVRAFSLSMAILAALLLDDHVALAVWLASAHVVLARAAAEGRGDGAFAETVEGRLTRLLTGKLALELGAISYSVYLVHMIVLAPLLYALSRAGVTEPVQAAGLTIGVVVGTWLLARILYLAVERPGIWLGTRLAAKLSK